MWDFVFSPVLAHSISPNYNDDLFFVCFVVAFSRLYIFTYDRFLPFASLRLRTKLMRALRRAGAQGTNFFFAEMRKSKDFDGDEVIQRMAVVVVVCDLIWTGATAADLYRE